MRLNADFSKPAVIRPEDYRWVDSPMPGVQRMMLDRIGDEVARATSLVRYAPDSRFSSHVHGGGEEFFVLAGVFGDEHGEYPAGSYVRNPIGTSHTPLIGSQGCLILVKLHQFEEADDAQIVVDTANGEWRKGEQAGVEYQHLHGFGDEHVMLIRWTPDTPYPMHEHTGGEEVFVLEGAYYDEHGEYPAGTWARAPHGSSHAPFTRGEGALLYLKVGHLPRG